jgi:hypothetical protein
VFAIDQGCWPLSSAGRLISLLGGYSFCSILFHFVPFCSLLFHFIPFCSFFFSSSAVAALRSGAAKTQVKALVGALVASAADVERAREEGVKVRADVVKGLVRSLVEKIHSFFLFCLTKLMFIVDPLLFFFSLLVLLAIVRNAGGTGQCVEQPRARSRGDGDRHGVFGERGDPWKRNQTTQ